MSLATIEANLRNSAETIFGHVKDFVEAEVPALSAEVQRLQATRTAQVLESVILTPAEDAMVAEIISKLPTLRGAESVPAAPETSAELVMPAEAPEPVSAGPVVGGTAT